MKRNQRLLFKLSLAGGAISTSLLWNLSAKAQSAIDEISLDPTKQSVSRNTIFFSLPILDGSDLHKLGED